MTDHEVPTTDETPAPYDLHRVRQRKLEATARLLGDTIRLSDAQWQSPSLLPGWSRAHVATHLSRNADGFNRVVEGFLSGQRMRMYDSEADRQSDIERGAHRGGLDLQIDLDTSASQLYETMNRLEALDQSRWDEQVELRAGLRVPAGLIATARLSEVVLHHVDLEVGFGINDVEEDIAGWMLEWMFFKLGSREDIPRLDITSTSGRSAQLGGFGQALTVSGDDQQLMGWLSGRGSDDQLTGTDNAVMPLIG